MPAETSSCTKSASVSLSNRIRFIEARTSKLQQTLKALTTKPEGKRPPPIQDSRFSTSLAQPSAKSHYASHKMLTHNDEESRNKRSPSREQRQEEMRAVKAQQCQQARKSKLVMQLRRV